MTTNALAARNRRHDLDPLLVQAQVARKIAQLEQSLAQSTQEAAELVRRYQEDLAAGVAAKRWSREPSGPQVLAQVYGDMIELERSHYAQVRVIELPNLVKRFILVYGDADDETVTHGTGPFSSLTEAAHWFLNGGR